MRKGCCRQGNSGRCPRSLGWCNYLTTGRANNIARDKVASVRRRGKHPTDPFVISLMTTLITLINRDLPSHISNAFSRCPFHSRPSGIYSLLEADEGEEDVFLAEAFFSRSLAGPRRPLFSSIRFETPPLAGRAAVNRGNARPRVPKSSARLLRAEKRSEMEQSLFRGTRVPGAGGPSPVRAHGSSGFYRRHGQKENTVTTLAANGLPIN